jgi:hypothetical protein
MCASSARFGAHISRCGLRQRIWVFIFQDVGFVSVFLMFQLKKLVVSSLFYEEMIVLFVNIKNIFLSLHLESVLRLLF